MAFGATRFSLQHDAGWKKQGFVGIDLLDGSRRTSHDGQPTTVQAAPTAVQADDSRLRGGVRGSELTTAYLDFEARQAKAQGMPLKPQWRAGEGSNPAPQERTAAAN